MDCAAIPATSGRRAAGHHRHRDLFALIRYVDRSIIWLNLLVLFAVCLLPFGSALVSHYYEEPVALRMFGLILIGTSVARTAIWAYATLRPSVAHEPLDRALIWSGLALSASRSHLRYRVRDRRGLPASQPGRLRLRAGLVLHRDHAAAQARPARFSRAAIHLAAGLGGRQPI